jgi:hypothetical protein
MNAWEVELRYLHCGIYLILLLAGITTQAQTTLGATPNHAGTIMLVEGDASIVPAGAAARPAKVGDIVREGDTLITRKDGEVHLTMQDTGFIALRPNTRFGIVSYKADGDEGDKGVFRLLAGGFRSVTGWIGKFSARGYRVNTPTATIGIRGTDHEPRYIPEGSTEGEPGTYDRVFAGQTYIETPAGQTAISPNQAGFVSVRPHDRPRLLAGVPVFFRPGPHEADIAAKHAEIQRVIDQRREERRKVIREKLAELNAMRAQSTALRKQNKEAMDRQKSATQEQIREMQAKREKLRADTTAANEALKAVQARRKALQEDVEAGRVSRDELQKRRKALNEESEAAQRALQNVRERQKALNDEADAQTDARSKAIQQRLNAMDDKRHNVTEKRHGVETESESMREEMKGLQKQENKRFRDELKADRKATPQPSTSSDDSKSR